MVPQINSSGFKLSVLALILVASVLSAQTPKEAIQRDVGTNNLTGTATGAPLKVATVAALKAATVGRMANGQQVELANYSTVNDGGGGIFYYSSASVAADNGGTVIAPTAGAGRWLRVFSGDVNARWFAAKGDGATNDTTAIQAAITAAAAISTPGGGAVFIPPGTYVVTTLTVPERVQIKGDGRGAVLTSAYAGFVLECGGSGVALYYGIGVRNLAIVATGDSTCGVRLRGTAGAVVENLYIEGTVSASNTGVGVAIDGGNTSSFFNKIDSVICNHIETGFKIYTSGSSTCTTTTFINCSAFGDVTSFPVNGSRGLVVAQDNGNGSVWLGGNFEQCQYGIDVEQDGGTMTVNGARFEANDVDVRFGLFTRGWLLSGCVNLTDVTNNSGTGFGRHTIIGCTTELAAQFLNEVYATRFNGIDEATTPVVRIRQYPLATVDPFQISGSNSNDLLFAVSSTGQIRLIEGYPQKITNGSGSPDGVITAEIGSIYCDRNGGASTTLYIKTSGTGNTGWTAK